METSNTKNNWNDTKAKISERFGKLTDDMIESAKENLDTLTHKIQSVYGYSKEQSEKEMTNFKATLAKPVEPIVAAPATAAAPLPAPEKVLHVVENKVA